MSTSKDDFLTRQLKKRTPEQRAKIMAHANEIIAVNQLLASGAKLGWYEERPDEDCIMVYGSRSQARCWKHKGTKIIRAIIIPIRKKS